MVRQCYPVIQRCWWGKCQRWIKKLSCHPLTCEESARVPWLLPTFGYITYSQFFFCTLRDWKPGEEPGMMVRAPTHTFNFCPLRFSTSRQTLTWIPDSFFSRYGLLKKPELQALLLVWYNGKINTNNGGIQKKTKTIIVYKHCIQANNIVHKHGIQHRRRKETWNVEAMLNRARRGRKMENNFASHSAAEIFFKSVFKCISFQTFPTVQ